MSSQNLKRMGGYLLNAIPDIPDIRDRYYDPSLIPLKPRIDPPQGLIILDQGLEGACTGFGLAAVINYLKCPPDAQSGASPRMLYEMAKQFDEWEGEDYSGSSCRGAIRGWYHNGVCQEQDWTYSSKKPGRLSPARAKQARETTIGAYYRLRPNIVDYHYALNEAGAIYVSARVHAGWQAPKNGRIRIKGQIIGGHAFAVVGYDEEGFWVQNSWGPTWGDQGLALWGYEDWQHHVQDAWVVTLACPTPSIFPGIARIGLTPEKDALFGKDPTRSQIAGHFVHLDDGRFNTTGKYASALADTLETTGHLKKIQRYDHILLYAHGGLNSTGASARRIAAMKETFKANGIYPYHFMYDTGLLEEIKDVVLRRKTDTVDRAEGITDISDWLIEKATRVPGRALWREMKSGAKKPFIPGGDGRKVVKAFGDVIKADHYPRQLHLVGHSTGAILIAWLLRELKRAKVPFRVASCSLMAPAATLDLFQSHFAPLLNRTGFGIDRFGIYNLSQALELDDHVGGIYQKSLLYLVSRAFEEDTRPKPLLGMMRYAGQASSLPTEAVFVSQGEPPKGTVVPTASNSHGGFDNDPATMNHILGRVLGAEPEKPFTLQSLTY
jgi:hypothetical protein